MEGEADEKDHGEAIGCYKTGIQGAGGGYWTLVLILGVLFFWV